MTNSWAGEGKWDFRARIGTLGKGKTDLPVRKLDVYYGGEEKSQVAERRLI